jgi:hypothetical protein
MRDENGREEFARRADVAYETYVRPNLTPADTGRFVALDVDSGLYEIDDDDLAAIHRLRDRKPDAAGWLVRVGSRYVDRLGWSGEATDLA